MPIKDLSNRVQIPRLGKIHLGIKKKSQKTGNEYPCATDYFVLPKDHVQYPDLVALFGDQPKELKILIPTEDEDKWCSQYYRCYSRSRGLVCKGDGDTASRMVAKGTDQLAWKDTEDKKLEVEMKTVDCKGKNCPIYQNKQCNEIMNLQFLIPDVIGLGVWQIDTTSIHSIININSASTLIKGLYGRVSLIPLWLTLEPRDVNNPDDGKKKTVYVLNLRVKDKLADLAIAARQQQELFLLPASDVEPPDDGMRFMPDFDPIAPDTHTPEENIKDLWPDGKSTSKPVEIVLASKPIEKTLRQEATKKGVDAAAGDADHLFDETVKAPTVDPPVVHPPVEGTVPWIVAKLKELNITDAGILQHILTVFGTPIEEGPVSNTLKQLTDDQRAKLTESIKKREAELKAKQAV